MSKAYAVVVKRGFSSRLRSRGNSTTLHSAVICVMRPPATSFLSGIRPVS